MNIIEELCKACGICVDVCPVSALRLNKDRVIIYKDVCIDCGICAKRCPFGAIQMKENFSDNQMVKDIRFQVTTACNLSCPWCFSESGKSSHRELDFSETVKMIDELIACGLKTMTLTGGEPLMRWDFSLAILKYLHQKNIYTKLFTNGLLLDESKVESLKGIADEIQISLYNRHQYSHIKQLVDKIKKMRIRVALRLTLTSKNYRNIKEIVKFVEKCKVGVFRARAFISAGRGKYHQNYLLGVKGYKFAFGYLASIRRNKDYIIQLLNPSFFFLYDNYIRPEMFAGLGFRGYSLCKCIDDMGTVLADGRVRACSYFPQELGNIREKKFSDIWINNPVKEGLKLKELNPVCMNCPYITICGGGCRANAYINLGNISLPDPNCPRICQ